MILQPDGVVKDLCAEGQRCSSQLISFIFWNRIKFFLKQIMTWLVRYLQGDEQFDTEQNNFWTGRDWDWMGQ